MEDGRPVVTAPNAQRPRRSEGAPGRLVRPRPGAADEV